VELLKYPELRDKPVAVAGDPEGRHGIILAKNMAAKRLGIQTAETIWQARRKCPDLILLPPHHEEYEAMSEAARANYDAAFDALSKDEAVNHAYVMMLSLTLLIVSLGLFFAYILLEFVVPKLFGNGQTVGKKVFGIAVMRVNGVKINSICLFIRTILGKYTIETMIPVLIGIMVYFGTIGIIGPVILFLILIMELVLMFTTYNRSLIHDLLATTVTVDLASQMIFDSEEALLDYRKKLHAEEAAKKTY
jgi:uncharacterized RDD family membrane protein YckC